MKWLNQFVVSMDVYPCKQSTTTLNVVWTLVESSLCILRIAWPHPHDWNKPEMYLSTSNHMQSINFIPQIVWNYFGYPRACLTTPTWNDHVNVLLLSGIILSTSSYCRFYIKTEFLSDFSHTKGCRGPSLMKIFEFYS